jgi:hypothetical protein
MFTILAVTAFVSSATATEVPRLAGQIDASFVERLRASITPATTAITIESAGGDEARAIEAAELLLDKNVTVRVDKYCLSACSLYILAAAKRVEVSSGAIVGFHAPAVGTAQLLWAAAPGSDATKAIDVTARRSVALYQRAHKDPKLLVDAFFGADVDCLILGKDGERIVSARVRNVVDVWTPERARLVAYGWTVDGFWPTSQAEQVQAAKAFLKEDAVVRFGMQYAAPRKPDITVSDVGCPAKRSPAP